MSTKLSVVEGVALAPLEEADLERRKADAAVLVAQKAKVADEKLLPLLRERLDRYREWGLALGPAENLGQATVTRSDSSSAERMAMHRARKIASVSEGEFAAYKAREEVDSLSLAGALRLAPSPPKKIVTREAGARDLKEQIQRIEMLVRELHKLQAVVDAVDPAIAKQAISGEEQDQWVQQLRQFRTGLSRVIGACE